MAGSMVVSDGQSLYRISESQLEQAREKGFYRPTEVGFTVVKADENVFQIPITDAEAAKSHGFVDLLEAEYRPAARKPSKHARLNKITTPPAAPDSDENSLLFDELSQAEEEELLAQQQAEEELAEATGWRWYMVCLRQWMVARKATLQRHARRQQHQHRDPLGHLFVACESCSGR